MSDQENGNSNSYQGFQPMQRGQFQADESTEDNESKTELTFSRQAHQQPEKSSIFPEWDLLPPRNIIRRKGLS